jgi:hypothetical protein
MRGQQTILRRTVSRKMEPMFYAMIIGREQKILEQEIGTEKLFKSALGKDLTSFSSANVIWLIQEW